MLKRVISGLMAIALSLSLILCVPQASATGESEKRLVLIERFDESNQLDSEYVFSYKMDKLERIDGKLYNIDPEINKYTETVICNDGKLVSGISEVEYEWGTVTSGESYEYNVLGQLVSGKAWEGGMVEYTYTYDSSGKLSRRNAIVEGGTEEIKYIYDGQGRLQQEKVTFTYEDDEYGDGWSEVVNYQYDNQGRVLRATRIDDWGSESVEYDYSYASFVLVEDTYGESLCLYDEQGLVIFDLFVDNPMYVTDNGYIEKIVDTDSYTQEQTTWVFTYEETAIPQKPEVEITESEWIQLHKDYANSTLFKDQVTQEFHGALGTAIEDIKKDKLITSYNTLDSINKILGFDLDLSDVQEYELLLAQILFSRNGVESIENIYSEYLSENILRICKEMLATTSDFADVDEEALGKQIAIVEAAKKGTKEFENALDDLLDQLEKVNVPDSFIESCEKAGFSFAAGFVGEQIDTITDTMKMYVLYLAAGEAYCDTSEAFGEMLRLMRQHIAIPSDNPLFEPLSVQKELVRDEDIIRLLDLSINSYSSVADPLSTPVSLYALAEAIENYYLSLEEYKERGAKAIAEACLVEYAHGTLDDLLDTEADVAISLFECIPVVKTFSVLKKLFSGTQFAINVFTDVDSIAYQGTMVMRLCAISYIHYLTVENLADISAWGNAYAGLSGGANISDVHQYAVLFDEAVTVYRATLSVAANYAEKYYTLYYNALPIKPNKPEPVLPVIGKDTNQYKSLKQKIFEIQMQKETLSRAWCHDDNPIYVPLLGSGSGAASDLMLCSITGSAAVTVKNESGDVIAVLTNKESRIAEGYEPYFYSARITSESDSYVKIAAIPKTFTISLESTQKERLDISISDYIDGELGETTQYLGVPVEKHSEGSIQGSTEKDKTLVIDKTTYAEGDYSDTAAKGRVNLSLIWTIVAVYVVAGGLTVGILIVHKKRKKNTRK